MFMFVACMILEEQVFLASVIHICYQISCMYIFVFVLLLYIQGFSFILVYKLFFSVYNILKIVVI